MSTPKSFEKLKGVMPANHKAMQKASKTGDIPNISTEPCAETPAFNSESLSAAFQAQAGMNAEHLNLAAHVTQQGPQEMRDFRSRMEETTSQLRGLRMPDTRVNIDGKKIEVPFELKQYAIDIDQDKYMKIMKGLLGRERIKQFRAHATKANQNTTPALWLNQMLAVECCKQYVFQIGREFGDQIEKIGNLSAEDQSLVSDYLEMALGSTLRKTLLDIAQAVGVPLFVVFIIITDEILRSHTAAAVPQTPSSLWDDEDEE